MGSGGSDGAINASFCVYKQDAPNGACYLVDFKTFAP
jgi:hypothetical protein